MAVRVDPRRSWHRAAVAAAFAIAALGALLPGCRSATPAVRTVVFMRSDVEYEDVWQATLAAMTLVFPLQDVNREARSLVTGFAYDDVNGESYRWKAKARVERLANHWAVRVSTEIERLHPSGWILVGFDDRMSLWLLQRIDEQILRLRGAPPREDGIEFVEPGSAPSRGEG